MIPRYLFNNFDVKHNAHSFACMLAIAPAAARTQGRTYELFVQLNLSIFEVCQLK